MQKDSQSRAWMTLLQVSPVHKFIAPKHMYPVSLDLSDHHQQNACVYKQRLCANLSSIDFKFIYQKNKFYHPRLSKCANVTTGDTLVGVARWSFLRSSSAIGRINMGTVQE